MRRGFLSRAAVLAAAIGFAVSAFAASFDNTILSSQKGAEANETVFATDTPEIHLSATITDEVASGSKLIVSWVAIDSGGAAPPNYKIAESAFDIGMIDNHLDAEISKPTTGWPVGTYQVQLVVDGELRQAIDFSVK